MNTNDVHRRLEAMGAAMEYIIIVPKNHRIPGFRREDKYNLIEIDNGYVVSGYERGTTFNERRFTDLDEACREITQRARRSAENKRRYQAKLAAKRRRSEGS